MASQSLLSPSQISLTLAQRAVYQRLKNQGIPDAVARQLAIALTKSIAKSDELVPPKAVQDACAKGLELAPEYGGAGLTDGAKARARAMSAGNVVSPAQIRRMKSFFARHTEQKQAQPPSPGYVAWQLWGGDAGKTWANSKADAVAKAQKALGAAYSHARASGKKKDKASVKRRANSYLADHGDAPVGKCVALAKSAYARAFVGQAKQTLDAPVFDAVHLAARAMAGGKTSGQRRRERATPDRQALAQQRDALKAQLADLEAQLAKGLGPLPQEVGTDELGADRKKKKAPKSAIVVKSAGRIVKAEATAYKKIVHSVVYEPNTPDTDDDFMVPDEIEKMAHAAMRDGILINHEHGPEDLGAHVVESYLAPADFAVEGPDGAAHVIKKGSWVVGLQITDDDTWARVLSGEYTGFSMEGSAVPLAS